MGEERGRAGENGGGTVTRACAAMIRDGAILMVRHRHGGREYWTLPGGGVEVGESPAEAAVREVREEVGLPVRVIRALFEREWAGYGRRGAGREYERCFLAEIDGEGEAVLGADPELTADAPLLVGVAWLALDSLRDDLQVAMVLETW